MFGEQFANLGGAHAAYVKPMLSGEAARLFPPASAIQPGLKLFALLAADGTPVTLTDSKDAAIANAWENQLRPVSLHQSAMTLPRIGIALQAFD